MYNTIRRKYLRPHMAYSVSKPCTKGVSCAKIGGRFENRRHLDLFPGAELLDSGAMDTLKALTKTDRGNQYVVIITPMCPKPTRPIPTPESWWTHITEVSLKHWIITFDIPSDFLTENGPEFVSTLFDLKCSYLCVKHSTTTAYHPQTNWQGEH